MVEVVLVMWVMALEFAERVLGELESDGAIMSRRQRTADYWQDAPMPRDQMMLIPTSLEEAIPAEQTVQAIARTPRCSYRLHRLG
jgi:hypothetical protein